MEEEKEEYEPNNLSGEISPYNLEYLKGEELKESWNTMEDYKSHIGFLTGT